MAAAVGVRGDYEAAQLRALAKRSEDAGQTRRLLALAAIYDGGPRAEPTIRRRVHEWLLRVALIR
jgi:putative transposase